MSKIIIATAALAIGLAGCVSQYKQEAKEEQQAKTMPVNCATAQADLATLQAEKASNAQRAAAGVTAVVPIGLVVGLVTGTEKEKGQVALGDYNKAIDKAIDRIKTTCNIQ
ncbi:MAG TPA: hypothetical protein VGP32_10095 [Steroidobacteraceae bacterium]|jgi:hypothetical protein|nr:hypothetical protein [Steroidobacteraceae bacterium]